MIDFILNYLGLILLWILIIWQLIAWKKRKKEGTYQYVKKDSWLQKTYIWEVFFRRTKYRPIASTFPWVIFIVPAMLMSLIYSIEILDNTINGKAKKIEEMSQVAGIVTKAFRGRGKNSYGYIKLKDIQGNEAKYELAPDFSNEKELKEFKEKIQNTKRIVHIYYVDKWFLTKGMYKVLYELRLNNKNIILNNKIKFKYDYEWFVQRDKNALPNLLWWIGYSLFGWIWLWFLNKKELPIHRLNKSKFYKKYNLKDK